MTIRSRSILLGCISLLGAGALLYWCVHALWWSKIRSEQANVLLNSSYRSAPRKTGARPDVAEPTTVAVTEAIPPPPETSQEKPRQFLCIEYVAGADAAVWAKVGAKMRGLVYQRDTIEEVVFDAKTEDICIELKKPFQTDLGMRIVLEIETLSTLVPGPSGLWVGGLRHVKESESETRFLASLARFKFRQTFAP